MAEIVTPQWVSKLPLFQPMGGTRLFLKVQSCTFFGQRLPAIFKHGFLVDEDKVYSTWPGYDALVKQMERMGKKSKLPQRQERTCTLGMAYPHNQQGSDGFPFLRPALFFLPNTPDEGVQDAAAWYDVEIGKKYRFNACAQPDIPQAHAESFAWRVSRMSALDLTPLLAYPSEARIRRIFGISSDSIIPSAHLPLVR